MRIKEISFVVLFLLLISLIVFFSNSEWSYIDCLNKCNEGVNVPNEFCNYPMVQKLIDHGKCWWSDITPNVLSP